MHPGLIQAVPMASCVRLLKWAMGPFLRKAAGSSGILRCNSEGGGPCRSFPIDITTDISLSEVLRVEK